MGRQDNSPARLAGAERVAVAVDDEADAHVVLLEAGLTGGPSDRAKIKNRYAERTVVRSAGRT